MCKNRYGVYGSFDIHLRWGIFTWFRRGTFKSRGSCGGSVLSSPRGLAGRSWWYTWGSGLFSQGSLEVLSGFRRFALGWVLQDLVGLSPRAWFCGGQKSYIVLYLGNYDGTISWIKLSLDIEQLISWIYLISWTEFNRKTTANTFHGHFYRENQWHKTYHYPFHFNRITMVISNC